MKFSTSALTVLFLASQTAAWTTRAAATFSVQRVAAVQLHSAALSVEQEGETATESFRLQYKNGSKAVSPWHDIDLKNADGSFNMVRIDPTGTCRL
jgi:hypothetical protein